MNARFRTATALTAALLVFCGSCAAADPKRSLIEHSEPVYPELARQMHVGGAIVLLITILPDGHVSDVKLESGHPLLANAAEVAVRRWRYTPGADMTVTLVQINFHPNL